MELYGSDRDIQFRCDFLVGPVAEHRIQYFPLPGAQGCWAGDRTPFRQQFLGTRNEATDQGTLCGHHDLEFAWILTAYKALHSKQSRDALDRAFQIRARSSSKLSISGGLLTEKKHVRDARLLSSFVLFKLRKYPNFSQISLPVRLAQDCMRQSFFDLDFDIVLSLERFVFTAAKQWVVAVASLEP